MVTVVTSGLIMPAEQLTYAQIAERLSVSPEAARAIVKRHRLPRSRSNDGKTLAAIDLEEIRHKPLPARSPRGPRSVTDVVASLKARIATLEAELVAEQQRSAPKTSPGRVTGRPASASASAPPNGSPPKTAWSPSGKPPAHSKNPRSRLPRRSPPGFRTCRERIRWLNRCAPFWKPRSRLLGRSPPDMARDDMVRAVALAAAAHDGSERLTDRDLKATDQLKAVLECMKEEAGF